MTLPDRSPESSAAGDTDPARRLPRVLFAISSLRAGGSEDQLVRLISETHGRTIEAQLLTFSAFGAPAHEQRIHELGIEHVRLLRQRGPRIFRALASLPRTLRVLRRLRPDLAYPWLEETAATLTPVARASGIPVVIARRNVIGSSIERTRPFGFLMRRIERHAVRVTANSTAVLEHAVARGIDPARLRLVHNGHPFVERLPAPQGAQVRIGYLANYRSEKGHLRLIEVLRNLRPKADWRVDMAGGGSLRGTVAAEVRRAGLTDRVQVGGAIDDRRAFWADHDIAVLLSDSEGSPNVLIEAALFGRPLLATDSGGTREVVSPDGGLLVPPDDPKAIAGALERLIDDRGLRERLGEGAHRHVAQHYSVDSFVRGHLAVLEEALPAP